MTSSTSRFSLVAAAAALLFTACGVESEGLIEAPIEATPNASDTPDLAQTEQRITSMSRSCSVDGYHWMSVSLDAYYSGSRIYMNGYWVKYGRSGGWAQNNANNEALNALNIHWAGPDWCPVNTWCYRAVRSEFNTCCSDLVMTAYFDRPNQGDPYCSVHWDF